MIILITGVPGAGKTLRALQLAREFADQGRVVYTAGIRKLDPASGFIEMPHSIEHWQALPDGAVVLLDEAQSYIPSRGPGKPPDWLEALTRHRHRGFDFLLTTQHPKLIDAFVRRLVGRHIHCERKMGLNRHLEVEWEECVDDVQDRGARYRAVKRQWAFDKTLFGLYESATQHTHARRIPWKLKLALLLPIAFAVLAWWAWQSIQGLADTAPAEVALAVGANGGGQAGAAAPAPVAPHENRPLFQTPEQYLAYFTPRVPALPWSAPAYDHRKVQAEPRIFCVARVHERHCTCYTEQVTKLAVPYAQCRAIARHGVYDPFQAPLETNNRDRDEWRRPERPEARSSSPPHSPNVPAPAIAAAAPLTVRPVYTPLP